MGILRPAIVLYDEPHPLGDDIGIIQSADMARKPDMLIIMGTSLKVHGLKKLVKDFAKSVHASPSSSSASKARTWAGKVIFVNRTPPGAEWSDVIDYHIAGETDVWVNKVVEDWKKMRPVDWEVQKTLVAIDGDASMNGAFKTVRNVLATPTGTKGKEKRKGGPFTTPNMNLTLNPKEATGKTGYRNENIPPTPGNMVLSTPDVFAVSTVKSPTPPSSPSKRRQAESHYGDLESSPSKRRVHKTKTVGLEEEERKLLFVESTNSRPEPASVTTDGIPEVELAVFDLSMQNLESPKPAAKARARKAIQTGVKGKPVVARPQTRLEVKNSKTILKKTSGIWVEVVH